MRKTLESELDVLGQPGLQVLLDEMEAHGFRFQTDQHYSMAQLHSFFSMVFGEDGARLIMERVMRGAGRP